jgi:hypothetical protein
MSLNACQSSSETIVTCLSRSKSGMQYSVCQVEDDRSDTMELIEWRGSKDPGGQGRVGATFYITLSSPHSLRAFFLTTARKTTLFVFS